MRRNSISSFEAVQCRSDKEKIRLGSSVKWQVIINIWFFVKIARPSDLKFLSIDSHYKMQIFIFPFVMYMTNCVVQQCTYRLCSLQTEQWPSAG